MRRETKLLHYGRPTLPGPANPPVVRASTILHDSLDSYADRLDQRANDDSILSYGRRGTTTAHALMSAINDLEGGDGCWLFPSGVAALATTLQAFLRHGDHLLMTETAFHATRTLYREFLEPNGVTLDVFPWDAIDLAKWWKPATKAVFVESPGSDLMEVMDIPAICSSAHERGAIVIADNTYGSGWLYRPLALGCDVSVIAGTKYLSGHADVMMGAATARGTAAPLLRDAVLAAGQTLAPDEAYATLRGIRTLHLRLERHEDNARRVTEWLQQQDAVLRVLHPSLPDHPGQALWQRDGMGTNGLVTLVLRHDFDQRRFLAALNLFAVGSSWGGFECLAKPVGSVTHRSLAASLGSSNLLRLHIGLEHHEDILEDLAQAFAAVS